MAEQEWGRGGWGADTCCPNCLSPGPLWLGAGPAAPRPGLAQGGGQDPSVPPRWFFIGLKEDDE